MQPVAAVEVPDIDQVQVGCGGRLEDVHPGRSTQPHRLGGESQSFGGTGASATAAGRHASTAAALEMVDRPAVGRVLVTAAFSC